MISGVSRDHGLVRSTRNQVHIGIQAPSELGVFAKEILPVHLAGRAGRRRTVAVGSLAPDRRPDSPRQTGASCISLTIR